MNVISLVQRDGMVHDQTMQNDPQQHDITTSVIFHGDHSLSKINQMSIGSQLLSSQYVADSISVNIL